MCATAVGSFSELIYPPHAEQRQAVFSDRQCLTTGGVYWPNIMSHCSALFGANT